MTVTAVPALVLIAMFLARICQFGETASGTLAPIVATLVLASPTCVRACRCT